MLRQGSDFIWKVSRQRRWWTSVPEDHLTQVRIWASFIVKGERVWQVIADFLVSESFVLAAVHIGVLKFMVLLHTFSKTNVFSVLQLFIFVSLGSVIPLRVRALRTGYPVYFRLQATFFLLWFNCKVVSYSWALGTLPGKWTSVTESKLVLFTT